ncbi:MAG: hypothetical protein IBX55_14590 [Methyloprofundus sp.]|nr:hypothetical protein [Methyloprofundus sp.]
MHCPICASSDFDFESEESNFVICNGCSTEYTREELQVQNSEAIEAHKNEIAQEVSRDFKKQLQDALKGSSFIKVK